MKEESTAEEHITIQNVFAEATPFSVDTDFSVSAESAQWEKPPPGILADDNAICATYPLSDYGNAKRLVKRFGDDLFCASSGIWYGWDGKYWRGSKNGNDVALQFVQKLLEAFADELTSIEEQGALQFEPAKDFEARMKRFRAHALNAGNISRTKGMVEHAEVMLRKEAVELDADPYLIGTPEQVLRVNPDGVELVDFDRDLFMTRYTGAVYDPDAQCPAFLEFIASLFPDAALLDYVQCLLGYTLTGSTVEQKLFILLGEGSDGKSTLVNVLQAVMRGYAKSLPFSSFASAGRFGNNEARSALAELPGRRLVVTSEADPTQIMSAGLVKSLTGGDLLTGRLLYKSFFEFHLRAKLLLCVNQLPRFSGFDEAIWRRLVVVPFAQQVSVPNKQLTKKLVAESSGILNWMLEGAVKWRKEGLIEPLAVTDALGAYKAMVNPIRRFIEECVTVSVGQTIAKRSLHTTYVLWCEEGGIDPLPPRAFAKEAEKHGLVSVKRSGAMHFADVSVNKEWRDI